MLKPERTTLKNIQHFVQTPQDFFKTNQQKPRKYPKNSAFSSHLCPAVCTIPEMPSATLSTPKVMKLFIRVQANLSESVIEGLTCPLLTLQGWGCATGTTCPRHGDPLPSFYGSRGYSQDPMAISEFVQILCAQKFQAVTVNS